MSIFDQDIILITEQKLRRELDNLYNITLRLKKISGDTSKIGKPFSKESVELYEKYVNTTEELYNCHNRITGYFASMSEYAHDTII